MREDEIIKYGEIVELLPNAQFMVQLDKKDPADEEEEPVVVWAQISGKLRFNKIQLILGDRVEVTFSKYDAEKGRITRRGEKKVRDGKVKKGNPKGKKRKQNA